MNYITLSNFESIILYVAVIFLAVSFMKAAEDHQTLDNPEDGVSLYGSDDSRYKLTTIKISNIYLVLSIITLALPAFFRFKVGLDYEGYWTRTEAMANASSLEAAMSIQNVEDSLAIISYYCGKLFGSSTYMYGFYALATQVLFVLGIWNFRKKISPSLALLMYCCTFYFRTFNIFRQALAIAIIFYSFQFIFERKYIKFSIAVLIAGFFHQTAFVCFFFLYYFRLNDKKNRIRRLIDYALPVVVLLLLESVMQFVFSIPVFAKYAAHYGAISSSSSIITLGTLLKILVGCIFFYSIITKRNESELDSYDDLFIKFMIWDIAVYILTFIVSYSSRFGLYFSIGSFISIASIYPNNRYKFNGGKVDIRICIIIIFAICYFYSVMSSNGYGQLPYSFWY